MRAKKEKVKRRISSFQFFSHYITFHDDSRVGKQLEKVSKSKPAEPKPLSSMGCPKETGPRLDISGPSEFGPTIVCC
jgi:hypothetical protein